MYDIAKLGHSRVTPLLLIYQPAGFLAILHGGKTPTHLTCVYIAHRTETSTKLNRGLSPRPAAAAPVRTHRRETLSTGCRTRWREITFTDSTGSIRFSGYSAEHVYQSYRGTHRTGASTLAAPFACHWGSSMAPGATEVPPSATTMPL